MTPEQLATFNELVAAYKGEALFRPSSASRLLGCPASVYLGAKAPRERKSSKYAQQGTAAHIVFNQALSGERQPDEWTDRMVQLDDGGMEGWFVDDEMTEAIQFSAADVRERITEDTEVFLEHPLSLQPLDPSDALLGQNRGTADVALVDRKRRKLTIIDLKYGQGVMVAGDSPQLLNYALMGLVGFGVDDGWTEVESVVIQPRARNEWERVKAHTFSPNTLLMDFAGKLVGAMEDALDPATPLKVDPTGGWCHWCPAKTICPALAAAGMAISGSSDMVTAAINSRTPMPPIPKEAPTLPDVAKMEGDAIGTVLTRRGAYDAWIEAVEQRAVQRLEAGLEVPGWELGRRTGNRNWKDVKTAENVVRVELGVSILDMYTQPKLLSPAQMEKLIEKDKRDGLAALVERPEGALYLKKSDGKKLASVAPKLTALPKH